MYFSHPKTHIMNKNTLIILILLVSTLFSCKKDDITAVEDNDYLIFGHFYNDCDGERCIETFLLTDGKLYENLNDNYKVQAEFNFVELSEERYQLTSDLLEYFPKKLLKDRRRTFGCPDCSGQGGLYIAYKKDGELLSWKIDPSKKDVPPYLHNFIDKVSQNLALLNK